MEEKLEKAIAAALTAAGAEGTAFTLERPAEAAHGDYATNAALVAASSLKKSPREVAEILLAELQKLPKSEVEKVEVAGPGFLNFTVAREQVAFAVSEAIAQGEDWGKSSTGADVSVMVEFTDPNPFKEMHIGHLMSNVIGEATARLIESTGARVLRANYQGDVGPHVAKALYALQKAGITTPESAKQIGDAYAEGARAYEEDENAKAEIDALTVALYRGDDRALMRLWKEGRDVSLAAFEELYRVLGTAFDYYFFESETAESGARIVRDNIARGVFEESEGAVIYRGEKKGLHTLVFITSRGTPTYEAKDVGLAFLKEERASADASIIVTAAEQVGHFKILLAALSEIAPGIARKTTHVPHGFLRLTTGKMSSREGNVITAAELLQSVMKKASEKNTDPLVAEQVAVGAVKFMVLRQSPGQDIIFDPEKSLSLTGDSGPYLQYALVRARKILAYAGNGEAGAAEPALPYAIERLILQYPGVVARAAALRAPHLLTNYLVELAAAWNAFYAAEQVLGSAEEAYKQRVARAFANTMSNGLALLGIPAPERM
jgi:arginyl-tRNA synthetase